MNAPRLGMNPTQVWINSLLTLVLVSSCGYVVHKVDQQGEQMTALQTQQAVMTVQLTALSVQLANVPAMQQQLAELTGQTVRNTDDIKQLRERQGK